jgi:hypothetical protein
MSEITGPLFWNTDIHFDHSEELSGDDAFQDFVFAGGSLGSLGFTTFHEGFKAIVEYICGFRN